MCGWCFHAMTWPVWLLEFPRNTAESVRRQTGAITRCPECDSPVSRIPHETESPCLGLALLQEADTPVTRSARTV